MTKVFSTIMNETVFAVSKGNKSNRKLRAFVSGACWEFDAEDWVEPRSSYVGNLSFENGKLFLRNAVKCVSVRTGTNGRVGNVNQTQSKYLNVGNYLVTVKHATYKKGIKAGTPEWDKILNAAAQFYFDYINSSLGKVYRTRDSKKWYK